MFERNCYNCMHYIIPKDNGNFYFRCESSGVTTMINRRKECTHDCKDFIQCRHPLVAIPCSICGRVSEFIQNITNHNSGTSVARCAEHIEWDKGTFVYSISKLSTEEICDHLGLTGEGDEEIIGLVDGVKLEDRIKTLRGKEIKAFNFLKENGPCLTMESFSKNMIGALGNMKSKGVISIGIVGRSYIDFTDNGKQKKAYFRACWINE